MPNFTDQRLDKVLTWCLMFFCGLALSVGAWFFSGLSEELGKLREAVGELKTEVRIQAERARRVDALDERLKLAENAIDLLDDRVIKLEPR